MNARERATAAFKTRFGHDPQWWGIAPGRVNLIGEHTDYNSGFVLPIAIDRTCVVAAAPATDPATFRVFAADLAEMWEYPRGTDLRSLLDVGDRGIRRGSWQSYVAGVIHFLGNSGVPLDLAIASDVPLGSGLSSSASLEVATAMALAHQQDVKERTVVALKCQRAEYEFAGVPCGIMDQYISAMALERHALLIDCLDNSARPVRMPESCEVLILNSGVRHALASGEYAVRRATCEAAARRLGLTSLRHATAAALGPLAGDELACARHVVSECLRVQSAAKALERNNPLEFGRLMKQSHASLRDDYRVSCRELDTLVNSACMQRGVYGARMTGGGFGGCIVALVERGKTQPVIEAVAAEYKRAHNRRCEPLVTVASEGARIERA